MDGPIGDVFSESLEQLLLVLRLHYENNIGPGDVRLSQTTNGARAQATRSGLKTRRAREDLFRRGASPLVAATDEEEVLLNFLHTWSAIEH